MDNKTGLGLKLYDKVIFIIIASLIGSILGYFIRLVALIAVKIQIIPFTPLWEWITGWSGYWVPIVGIAIGVVAGIIFSIYAFQDMLYISVTDEAVLFRQKKDKNLLWHIRVLSFGMKRSANM